MGSDNVPGNNYAFSIDLQSPWFLSKGAMIAYYGQLQFNALTQLHGQMLHMVARSFSARCISATTSWQKVSES